MPGIAAVGNGSDSTSSGFVSAAAARDRVPVLVEVVGEPDVDAARGGACHRVGERSRRPGRAGGCRRSRSRAVLRLRDPAGERVRDLVGGLAAVGERAELDRALAARAAALRARFAAWYSASESGESTSPSVRWSGAISCGGGDAEALREDRRRAFAPSCRRTRAARRGGASGRRRLSPRSRSARRGRRTRRRRPRRGRARASPSSPGSGGSRASP